MTSSSTAVVLNTPSSVPLGFFCHPSWSSTIERYWHACVDAEIEEHDAEVVVLEATSRLERARRQRLASLAGYRDAIGARLQFSRQEDV